MIFQVSGSNEFLNNIFGRDDVCQELKDCKSKCCVDKIEDDENMGDYFSSGRLIKKLQEQMKILKEKNISLENENSLLRFCKNWRYIYHGQEPEWCKTF